MIASLREWGRRMIKQKIAPGNCEQAEGRAARSCEGRACVVKSHMEKISEGSWVDSGFLGF